MIKVTIKRRKKTGLFEKVGESTIFVNGVHTYNGQTSGPHFVFNIKDLNGNILIESFLEAQSKWNAFLGKGRYLIRGADGIILSSIIFNGFRRSITVAGNIYPCPRKSTLSFPSATITMDERANSAQLDLSESDLLLNYLGLAHYMWLFQESSGGD
jgi:hypothetical protein